MKQFPTSDAFWRFAKEIALQNRYLRSADAERFLKAVARTCHGRKRTIEGGTVFWRAQVGHDWVVDPEKAGASRSPFGKPHEATAGPRL
jgi:hypothetical protein